MARPGSHWEGGSGLCAVLSTEGKSDETKRGKTTTASVTARLGGYEIFSRSTRGPALILLVLLLCRRRFSRHGPAGSIYRAVSRDDSSHELLVVIFLLG